MELNWKIWFWQNREDLLTKTNLETDVSGLPILPVVIIANVRRDDSSARFCLEFGKYYYCLVGDEWWASSDSGLLNYVDFYRGNATILRGGMIPNDLFESAYYQAKKDPELLAITQEEFMRDRGNGYAEITRRYGSAES